VYFKNFIGDCYEIFTSKAAIIEHVVIKKL